MSYRRRGRGWRRGLPRATATVLHHRGTPLWVRPFSCWTSHPNSHPKRPLLPGQSSDLTGREQPSRTGMSNRNRITSSFLKRQAQGNWSPSSGCEGDLAILSESNHRAKFWKTVSGFSPLGKGHEEVDCFPGEKRTALDNPFQGLKVQPVPPSNLAHSHPKLYKVQLLVSVSAMKGTRRRDESQSFNFGAKARLGFAPLPSHVLYPVLLMRMQRGWPIFTKDQP